MYFNVNISGSSYTTNTGVIELDIIGGTPPYLIDYRTFDGSPFGGTPVDNGLSPGSPQYTKAINVPIGAYYIDVTDQYGLGTKETECVVVTYSGYTQFNIDQEPTDETDILCPTDCVEFFLLTEDGCPIDFNIDGCPPCYLTGLEPGNLEEGDCIIFEDCNIQLETLI